MKTAYAFGLAAAHPAQDCPLPPDGERETDYKEEQKVDATAQQDDEACVIRVPRRAAHVIENGRRCPAIETVHWLGQHLELCPVRLLRMDNGGKVATGTEQIGRAHV